MRHRRPRSAASTVAALALMTVLAACGSGSGGETATGETAPGEAASGGAAAGGEEGELIVFAAASLRIVMDDIAADFEEANPGTTLQVSYAGSADLLAQISDGAPADTLVTADRETMERAVDEGLVVGEPQVVATNELTIVTEPGNPLGLTGLADAAAAEVDLVVCAPQVPCGRTALDIAEAQGVTLSPVSEENSVTDVLGKVLNGQADAGLVYATDARSAGEDVAEVPLEGAEAERTEYPAAVVAESDSPELAAEFVEFLTEPASQQRLMDVGFGAP